MAIGNVWHYSSSETQFNSSATKYTHIWNGQVIVDQIAVKTQFIFLEQNKELTSTIFRFLEKSNVEMK